MTFRKILLNINIHYLSSVNSNIFSKSNNKLNNCSILGLKALCFLRLFYVIKVLKCCTTHLYRSCLKRTRCNEIHFLFKLIFLVKASKVSAKQWRDASARWGNARSMYLMRLIITHIIFIRHRTLNREILTWVLQSVFYGIIYQCHGCRG